MKHKLVLPKSQIEFEILGGKPMLYFDGKVFNHLQIHDLIDRLPLEDKYVLATKGMQKIVDLMKETA